MKLEEVALYYPLLTNGDEEICKIIFYMNELNQTMMNWFKKHSSAYKHSSKTVEKIPEEPFITLMEFYDKTHICHPSTLSKLMRTDREFFHKCGHRKGETDSKGTMFYIRSEAAISYLANCKSGRLRNKVKKYFEKKQERECQKNAA